MKHISEDRIVFWTMFGLLCFSAKVALFIFAGGLAYNLIAQFTTKGPK